MLGFDIPVSRQCVFFCTGFHFSIEQHIQVSLHNPELNIQEDYKYQCQDNQSVRGRLRIRERGEHQKPSLYQGAVLETTPAILCTGGPR